jgi:hypothetical protein
MSETTTDLPESDEVIEGFVDENDRQIAYRAEAHPTQAHSSARPAVVQNTGVTDLGCPGPAASSTAARSRATSPTKHHRSQSSPSDGCCICPTT